MIKGMTFPRSGRLSEFKSYGKGCASVQVECFLGLAADFPRLARELLSKKFC